MTNTTSGILLVSTTSTSVILQADLNLVWNLISSLCPLAGTSWHSTEYNHCYDNFNFRSWVNSNLKVCNWNLKVLLVAYWVQKVYWVQTWKYGKGVEVEGHLLLHGVTAWLSLGDSSLLIELQVVEVFPVSHKVGLKLAHIIVPYHMDDPTWVTSWW